MLSASPVCLLPLDKGLVTEHVRWDASHFRHPEGRLVCLSLSLCSALAVNRQKHAAPDLSKPLNHIG